MSDGMKAALDACIAAIDALIDYHEVQATMADAMDCPTTWHDTRKAELRAHRGLILNEHGVQTG